MSDFSVMRQNMVKGQILPENVTNPFVIHAFLKVPREKFVPRQLARVAYMDANFSLHKGGFVLRPATLARLLEACTPLPSETILYVAAGTGYGPALLSKMGASVIALNSEEILAQEAERLVQDLQLSSIKVVLGPLVEGWETDSPYDKIVIEGCIEVIPKELALQLKEGGVIVTFRHCKDRGMTAIKCMKEKGVLTAIPLFDAFVPRLDAFQIRKTFVFE